MDKFAQLKILESRLESALLLESVSTIRIGKILDTISIERLFCLSRPQTLKQYCKSQFNLEKSSVYNYITAWRVSQSLTIAPRHKRLVSVSALAKIATYPAQQRRRIWFFEWFEKPSVSNLLKLCSSNQVQVPGNNEYYTPPDLVLLAKRMNNGSPFDLDPCSSLVANSLHEGLLAREIYTAQDNGLEKEWHGRVFLNPPYGVSTSGQSMQEI